MTPSAFVLIVLFSMPNGTGLVWHERTERFPTMEACQVEAASFGQGFKTPHGRMLFNHTPFARVDMACMAEEVYQEFEQSQKESLDKKGQPKPSNIRGKGREWSA